MRAFVSSRSYGAALFRLRKEDLGELRHHSGISSAWPISYDELEPYYAQAEAMYHVHGQAKDVQATTLMGDPIGLGAASLARAGPALTCPR